MINKNSEKTISIAIGFPDTNAGGSALGSCLISVLKKHFPSYSFNYISTSNNEDQINKEYQFIQKEHPDLKIIPHPVLRGKSYKKEMNKIKKTFISLEKIMLTIAFLLFPNFFTRLKGTFSDINNSSLLVARGTHIFDIPERYGRVMFSLYLLLFPLIAAWRCKVPYIVYAQSVGPLHNPLNRILIRFVYNKAVYVLAREQITKNFLKNQLKINPSKIHRVPDTAFNLSPPRNEEIKQAIVQYQLEGKKYLVLIIRELIKRSESTENLFPVIRNAVSNLIKKELVSHVVIITQCHYFQTNTSSESDTVVSNALYKYLTNSFSESHLLNGNVILIDKALSPKTLISLYGGARYVLAMRLHAAIFSLISGTPTITISYSGYKAEGIMKELSLDNNVINVADLNESNLLNTFDRLEGNYEFENKKIKKIINEMNLKSKNVPQIFSHLLV